ncbi:hypothetical protein JZ751_028169 [Albula glossodonta]|uniref:Uncharacterized protein n=1 Tax=Albula glossodonta TaxID=121402 RepID=A0A8T2PEU7_9TELE|nr:hypothetical protein JZ751_028169 [Albula glossodonta]
MIPPADSLLLYDNPVLVTRKSPQPQAAPGKVNTQQQTSSSLVPPPPKSKCPTPDPNREKN